MRRRPHQAGPRIWTTQTYDRLSRYYDTLMRWLFPMGEQGRVRIAEKLAVGSVLDVACGTGTLLAMAARKGLRCHGTDISMGMLDQAREKVPEAGFSLASYYALPYSEGTFDYVVATNALSGGFIDAGKVLLEMLRVCKRGGWVYIAEWPKASRDTFLERVVVSLARLNDDAPKDYIALFSALGYGPEVDVLGPRFHVYGVRK